MSPMPFGSPETHDHTSDILAARTKELNLLRASHTALLAAAKDAILYIEDNARYNALRAAIDAAEELKL